MLHLSCKYLYHWLTELLQAKVIRTVLETLILAAQQKVTIKIQATESLKSSKKEPFLIDVLCHKGI